jgi:hypothetical protein
MVGRRKVIPGKFMAMGIGALLLISSVVAMIASFRSMAIENGDLRSDKAQLEQTLKESEAEKLDQANQVTHLTELFMSAMKDREKAEKDAKQWEGEYNEAISNDEDFKKWDATPLPGGLISMYGSQRGTSNENSSGKGGGTVLSHPANATP